MLVVAVRSVAGVAPPAGWTRAVRDNNNVNESIDVFFKANAAAQGTSTGFTGIAAIAMEFSGNFSEVDKTRTGDGFSTTLDTGATLPQSYAEDLALAAFACTTQNPGGFSSGYSIVDEFMSLSVVYRMKSTADASQVTATIAAPATWSAVIATFKP